MSAIERLYEIDNKTIKKSVNIEDKLYRELKLFVEKNYDATISEIINICIEDYIAKNIPSYYEKPKNESVTYRSIMMRKKNMTALQKMQKKTGISVTRLLNCAVKEFIEKC